MMVYVTLERSKLSLQKVLANRQISDPANFQHLTCFGFVLIVKAAQKTENRGSFG